MTTRLPVLLYHDLEPEDRPLRKSNLAAQDTVVNAGSFEEQIRCLSENRYETISLSEYFRYAGQKERDFSGKIIITFDDGHESNYRLAYPVLRKYGFKAAFFIVAGGVDREGRLTREQIREMSENGMEIGSHGLTHKYLPLMDRDEAAYELSESKRILEEITGRTVDFFAFPGGHYSRMILELLKMSGYSGACSCLQGLNSCKTNPYLIRRIEIRRNLSAAGIKHIFNPFNIAFYQFIDFLKGLLRRAIGLKAYSKVREKLYKYYLFKR